MQVPAMRQRSHRLERCGPEVGGDLFDPAVQMGWAAGLRAKRSESRPIVERESPRNPRFQPLGYALPVKDIKVSNPDEILSVKGSQHSDSFRSQCYVVGADLYFRVSMSTAAEGQYWRVRNAWYALREWPAVSISEALAMMEETFMNYASEMLIPILRKLKRPYWPSPSNETSAGTAPEGEAGQHSRP